MSSVLRSTSSSSPTSDSTGGAYTRKLFFYAEVDSPQGKEYSITNEELGKKLAGEKDLSESEKKELDEKLSELLSDLEVIEEVFYYTHPLNWWQLWKGYMHHAYIVFETQNWWWSIEKNDAGVIIQRSKKIEYVRDMYYRNKRQEGLTTGITKEKEKSVKKTMKQLIVHVYEAKYVIEDYHFLEKNCQEFADKIYQFL